MERLVESELLEVLEEEIILEYFCNFVNISGFDKCFKERIEYDRLVNKEVVDFFFCIFE